MRFTRKNCSMNKTAAEKKLILLGKFGKVVL